MPQFFQTYGLYIFIMVFFGAMMWFSNRSRKKFAAQREAEQENLRASFTPGQWVRTRVGFWGRYVDRDGDIVILETPNGAETYWELSMIASIGEPPFADDSDPEDTPTGLEEQVLGLESSESNQTDEPKTDPSTK